MLQQIREKFTGVFAVVLLGMLAISFVFFGIGNFNFLNAGNAAVVDDMEISIFQLENAYQNQLLQLSDFSDLPPETLQLIRRNTLERLIRDALVDVYVAKTGYRIGDEQIAELIQQEPTFQVDGVFSKDAYYAWLEQQVIDARMFEASQRAAMRTSQVQRGIGATAFVTPSEYRRYLNLFAEERVVSLATFDIAALADTIVVSDEDVQEFYDSRPDAFRADESVDFQYVEVDRSALAEQIDVSDEALQQYYEANDTRFLQDESRRARHILITFDGDEAAAEELATSLTARAQAGEPFEDLARQYSKDGGTSERGGDLGTMLQTQMAGPLGDAIFSIAEGEIYGPVRTDFGFHVVRLDEIIAGGPLPLDQVRGELLTELRAQSVEDRYRDLERQLSDAVFDASDLETIAANAGLELRTASEFGRAGGAPFGANQSVIDAVFDPIIMEDRQISDLIEVDADRSIMVQVTAYNEAARRPVEDVRDEIVFQLQSARALNIVEDRSRRLTEALEDGRAFAEMAFEMEAAYEENVVMSRFEAERDQVLMDAIFREKKPAPGNARLGSIVAGTGDYVVYMISAVVPGRPESIPLAERDRRKEELQMGFGAADYNAFVNQLARTTDIERSEDALTGPEFLQ
jgi:peptidyl-prolyl cis-trans isomerase D